MTENGLRVIDLARERVLARRVFLADGYFSRLRGLIGRAPLPADAALWIQPCQQVHTHFMGYALHVVFLDAEQRVLRVIEHMRPWRISPWVRQAHTVLEFNGNHPLQVTAGDRLRVARD